jgi:hypothetical protein
MTRLYKLTKDKLLSVSQAKLANENMLQKNGRAMLGGQRDAGRVI